MRLAPIEVEILFIVKKKALRLPVCRQVDAQGDNNKKIATESGNILAEKGNGVLQIIKKCRMSTGHSPLNIKLKILTNYVVFII